MFKKIENKLDEIADGKHDAALRWSYMIYVISILGLLFMNYSDEIFEIVKHIIGMP